MLFTEFRKKEVINMRDCRKLGYVTDLEFDECKGCICKIKVSDHWCFCSHIPFWPFDPDYVIGYNEIKQIGPDVIVVDIC